MEAGFEREISSDEVYVLTKMEDYIALWLQNHQPDGFGNGSIGETVLWHFVKELSEGDIEVESRTEQIKKCIDIEYYARQKLVEIHKQIAETHAEYMRIIKDTNADDYDTKMNASAQRLKLFSFGTDLLAEILR